MDHLLSRKEAGMSKVGKTKDNLKKCVCIKCPTFTNAAKQHPEMTSQNLATIDVTALHHLESMYCCFGKSRLIEVKKGCNCFSCKNFKEHALTDGLFCETEEL